MAQNLYDNHTLVKLGCNDCKGCDSCCRQMGDSIVLDPYDIWQLESNLHCNFAQLMQDFMELHVVNGLILPNIKMQGSTDCCGFLKEDGRCAIHAFRPGLCRLFPLGRNYEGETLRYFLLQDVCPHTGNAKIKIKKWLDVPNYGKYEEFLIKWHNLRKKLQLEIAKENAGETEGMKKTQDSLAHLKEINLCMLHIFYEKPYEPEDFYGQFAERMREWDKL